MTDKDGDGEGSPDDGSPDGADDASPADGSPADGVPGDDGDSSGAGDGRPGDGGADDDGDPSEPGDAPSTDGSADEATAPSEGEEDAGDDGDSARDEGGAATGADRGETPPPGDPDDSFDPASEAEVAALRQELRDFREDVESRTLHRESVEDDLRDYVRRRIRRGHARGWGPYVVLLYGTLMTVGGFYYLSGLWAVLAMVVIWLSTLGLYVFMLVVGIGLTVTGLPKRAVERVRNR